MPEERSDDLQPVDPKGEWVDAFAVYAELIPLLGGVVSNVMNGWTQDRRMRRVGEVLSDLSGRLQRLGDKVDKRSEDCIRSDEFEDLLDRTLRQAATERHENKRRLYAAILAGAIENPGESSYHEQLRMLTTIEGLQPDHLRILRAMPEDTPLVTLVIDRNGRQITYRIDARAPKHTVRRAALPEPVAPEPVAPEPKKPEPVPPEPAGPEDR